MLRKGLSLFFLSLLPACVAKADVTVYLTPYYFLSLGTEVLSTCPAGVVVGGCGNLPATFLTVSEVPQQGGAGFEGLISVFGFAGGTQRVNEVYDQTTFSQTLPDFNLGPNSGGLWDLSLTLNGQGNFLLVVTAIDQPPKVFNTCSDLPIQQFVEVPEDGIELLLIAPEPALSASVGAALVATLIGFAVLRRRRTRQPR